MIERDWRGETRRHALAYRKSSKILVNRQYGLPMKVLIDVD